MPCDADEAFQGYVSILSEPVTTSFLLSGFLQILPSSVDGHFLFKKQIRVPHAPGSSFCNLPKNCYCALYSLRKFPSIDPSLKRFALLLLSGKGASMKMLLLHMSKTYPPWVGERLEKPPCYSYSDPEDHAALRQETSGALV